jgi:phosphomannomutase
LIASLSGIRGILNKDITLADVSRYAGNFAKVAGSREVLMARDTRSTGPALSRAVAAGMMSYGKTVVDYGIISTPALFRESRVSGKPGVMVTASHNEPEFNGLKFVIGGKGIGRDAFDAVVNGTRSASEGFLPGSVRPAQRPSYVEDLVLRFGEASCEGVRVALDLGGGAAVSHVVRLLERLGCKVLSVNDACGVFNRKVDPVADDLLVLRKLVKGRHCQLGLGFDCDGDRLVIVDSEGKKRTGDHMLTLALVELLAETGERKVVVSVDTTQAVDMVTEKEGGQVFRSRVGEANVVGMMIEEGARLGGEGSSGGLIDGSFNHCRDSMIAAVVIARALKLRGEKFFDSVPLYHQERLALVMPRPGARRAIKRLEGRYGDADTTDGVKIWLSKRSWALIRPSGTEDLVRVSAEAETSKEARRIAASFAAKLRELSK